jgi:rSAM/selenodomain-associated transferase 2
MKIAIVIPALNEGARIEATLAPARLAADRCVVVDGGSTDDTIARARAAGAQIVLGAERGRASQMNAGAAVCEADGVDVLMFLHADTVLAPGWDTAIAHALDRGYQWGRFDVRLDADAPTLRLVSAMMNLRSRLTGICTGDQAIFVTRALWSRSGGFAPIALMEDVELSARLKRAGHRPACLRTHVTVSARRWTGRGVWRTIVLMWVLRAMYAMGASPQRIHRLYYGKAP